MQQLVSLLATNSKVGYAMKMSGAQHCLCTLANFFFREYLSQNVSWTLSGW